MNYPLAICGDPRTNHGTILALLNLALDGFLEEKDMVKAQHLGFNFMPNENMFQFHVYPHFLCGDMG